VELSPEVEDVVLAAGSENIWSCLKNFLFLCPVKLHNSMRLYSCVTMVDLFDGLY
jgi:hypothetical protein